MFYHFSCPPTFLNPMSAFSDAGAPDTINILPACVHSNHSMGPALDRERPRAYLTIDMEAAGREGRAARLEVPHQGRRTGFAGVEPSDRRVACHSSDT